MGQGKCDLLCGWVLTSGGGAWYNVGEVMRVSNDENLVVRSRKKSREIAVALKSVRVAKVKPQIPPKLPEDADKIWNKVNINAKD